MRVTAERMGAGALVILGAIFVPWQKAGAQTTIAPLVAGDDPEYEIDPISAGPFRLAPRLIVAASYNDNVLASPDGTEIEDVEFIVRPEIDARVGDDNLRFDLSGFGEFSRFADFTSENADTYGLSGAFSYSPSIGNRLNFEAGFARLKENRGDPEARDPAEPGPRLIDDTFASVSYRRAGGRILVDLEATFSDLDAVSPLDDDRDFKTYSTRATVGYRVSEPVYLTLTGFANVRDFRLEATPVDPDRDATTYGGQVGVTLLESGRLRGRARIGAFRFDPEDPRLQERTGFSVDASVAYIPVPRAAIILEAFRGDVATFRRGAQARTDTRVSLTGQFEMRHNFFARTGVRWLRTRFVGSGVEEEIFGSTIAVEYLSNRRLSLLGEVIANQRDSDDPTQEFDRFRAVLSARIRF